MEFHISRKARDLYKFDESLYGFSGNVIFANFLNVRRFVQKINTKRDLVRFPELAVHAGDMNAMGLIDEILHLVAAAYREEINPQTMKQAVAFIEKKIGKDKIDHAIRQFSDQFPPLAVYKGSISLEAYLAGESDGIPNRTAAIEEMLLLWLANVNPAFSPFSELFDDEALEKQTAYPSIIEALQTFFEAQPHFGPDDQPLVLMLRSPALVAPYSLEGQLEYIRSRWGKLLGKYLYKLLSSLDLMREERKAGFAGSGPTEVVNFASLTPDLERFSPDSEWMPRVVMIAKNTYVWLDQLSQKYKRDIHHLDQVPDEELDLLARWGFTALWLIGLWERSSASKRIKQMCGNPEAEASAYSLKDYEISADLGGDQAFQNLKSRAWQRGVRMAGDMVPNHVGIDGRWVIQHPDWFLALDYCPYPAYTFNGPNLSSDDRVGIYLEDHYYTRSDAAVVFKRVDQWTGDTKYVYHGNDGTSMPWNDTAQLNYLNPETREAVIQTILHVARQFPVIRFDAAMTLAKKHIQRLWFPEPGSGGAIPSRSEHGLSRADFEKAIPTEFWREVVDRVAKEAPDTLLLAEAFWLLEGYFVRTLGMHRVYNSAFMNMLKNEENAKYRSVIKNTLEFDPEILKRYVNFMNNPDEDTAVAQFGRDDKYFGVCVLLSTLPGLPMFGHGQIEGFTEKYGMEFRRAYWEEQPDPWLIGRHEREIFPILRKRYLFAGVTDFLLYDFFAPEGHVNENVFAYSNRAGHERALVIYNNVYGEAEGWVRLSSAYAVKEGDQRRTIQKTLGQGLSLSERPDAFCVFRDQISGLEYLRSSRMIHEQGLFVKLSGYQYHVFTNFREVRDREGEPYRQLADYLGGRGVPSIEEALTEIFLQPVHSVFKLLVNPLTLHAVIEALIDNPAKKSNTALLDDFAQSMDQIAAEIEVFLHVPETEFRLGAITRGELDILLQLPAPEGRSPIPSLSKLSAVQDALHDLFEHPDFAVGVLFHWITVHRLGAVQNPQDSAGLSRSWIDEWLLGKIIGNVISGLSFTEEQSWQAGLLIRILTVHHEWFSKIFTSDTTLSVLLESLFHDQDVLQFLRINRHQEVLWYHKESFEMLFRFLTAVAVIGLLTDSESSASEIGKRFTFLDYLLTRINDAEQKSGYQVEKLVEAVRAQTK